MGVTVKWDLLYDPRKYKLIFQKYAETEPTVKPGKENKRRSRVMAQPKGTLEHTVGSRDTLASIAAQFDTTTSELKKLNRLMTQMVFPGQVIYVPDQNFIPSTPSTPSSVDDKSLTINIPEVSPPPTDSSDKTDVKSPFPDFSLRQFLYAAKDVSLLKMRIPGHAERAQKAEVPQALTDDEAKRLDEECYERFIKVQVKHITDGQGVVNGVLLVTPNALMFDPNVSDPLVMEHGADQYGMIAPMDTVISAAMYHDIAAMRLSRQTASDEVKPKPVVYHTEGCPLFLEEEKKRKKEEEEEEMKEKFEEEEEEKAEETKEDQAEEDEGAAASSSPPRKDQLQRIPRQMSTCSCGAVSDNSKPIDSEMDDERSVWEEKEDTEGHGAEEASGRTQRLSGDKSPMLVTTPHLQIDSSNVFSYDDIEPSRGRLSSSPRDLSPSRRSPSPSSLSPRHFSHTTGILSRTIGSISSMGSFAGAQLVDFSSGLFTRSQEERGRVKDVSEMESGQTPPKTPWVLGGGDQDEKKLIDLEVENVVKLGDKPELFKPLDEILPRPARLYDDPPLYLCLKVGIPTNKRISKTCPIEAYLKNKRKPEYWFSIPREKVDQLYAFFIQWSPNIYGVEEDIDPRERGFVVLDDTSDNEEDDGMDVVEDHFLDSRGKMVRQMTKDWEIVNIEEARRRISAAELENLPLPELSESSNIMDEEHIRRLCFHLPARAEGYPWNLVYSSDRHGFSLKTLYRNMNDIDSPILLVIKDTRDHVFGGIVPCALKISDHFYGNGESFLFTFFPDFKKFPWTGHNNYFLKGNTESMSVGAGEGSFGLWLDGDLYHGRSQSCKTYSNDILSETEDFVIKGLEAWSF
ncbi:hypothetical protein CAPTEDRAFT_218966 [Capitella teleta]|uniref:Oxidation resistance protein 1 n=1 Tax=Capitella teleta TaxID=283909 RepID=R7VH22_CAPTE|nr:hypothetical protein CAPTEDRAFT_218966 [Capitella teleta]|eukprot:ELU17867.1 hypothetical protein CAPTEDRAFT_218966 [Capitella teleta]